MSTAATDYPSPPAALQCMEIWGGIGRADTTISVPGIDAAVMAQPHLNADQGGDIHYITLCGAGEISRFLIADVSGHGAAVASVAAELRRIIRRYMLTHRPTRLAKALNRDFARRAKAGQFATAVVATYHAKTDELFVCNAGHPWPLLYRAATGRWDYLTDNLPAHPASPQNIPLGVLPNAGYSQISTRLAVGDILLLYSDSLIEAVNVHRDMLGITGLLELVQHIAGSDPQQIARSVLDAVNAYRGQPADDDVTLVALHHNGSDPPRRTFRETLRVIGKILGVVKV